jgi:hypothetical protein
MGAANYVAFEPGFLEDGHGSQSNYPAVVGIGTHGPVGGPARHAGAGRCDHRLERDRGQRHGDSAQRNTAVARARDRAWRDHDAVRAVDQKGAAYAVDLRAPAGTSLDASVAAAAHGVLVRLAPAQRAMLDAALNATLAKVADGPVKSEGVSLGAQIAEKIVAARGADKSDAKVTFTTKPGHGLYQLTPPQSPMPAILTHWGGVTPFVLRDRSGLEFKGPPAFTSAEFAREFDEIKSVGARHSTTRTADQTAAAIFWTIQTGVPWFAAARAASAAKRLSPSDNAKLLAILAMAAADSQIVASRKNTRACTGARSRPSARRAISTSARSRATRTGSRSS